jgi:hypothetical protein
LIAFTPERLEAALAVGELACPVCCGRFIAVGWFARSREVRLAARGAIGHAAARSRAKSVAVVVGAAPSRRGGAICT